MIKNTIGFPLYLLGIIFSVIAITFFISNRLSSGKIKLHISSSRNKHLELILFALGLILGILTIVTAKIYVDFVEGFCWVGLAIVNLFALKSGLDFREKGIFYFGELIRWEAIESLGWEKHENTYRLKIIRRTFFFSFSKEINLTIPVEKVEDVNLLLIQYLPGRFCYQSQ